MNTNLRIGILQQIIRDYRCATKNITPPGGGWGVTYAPETNTLSTNSMVSISLYTSLIQQVYLLSVTLSSGGTHVIHTRVHTQTQIYSYIYLDCTTLYIKGSNCSRGSLAVTRVWICMDNMLADKYVTPGLKSTVTIPMNMRRWYSVVLLLAQSHRLWANS